MERIDNFGERLGTEVALAAMADRNGAGFSLFCADDEHVGNFLELGVADFCLELFVAVVEMDAKVVAFESFGDVLGVIGNFFANGANLDLDRREPQGECAGVVLDQDAEESFDGPKQRPMHHERLMLGAVFGDVFQAETRRQIEIELDGRELPGTADGVDELDVDFGAVEGRLAGNGLIRNVEALHGFGQRGSGALPVFRFAGVIFRVRRVPIGKLDFEFIEAEIFHDGEGKVDAGLDFGFDLRRHAEYVCVVLREPAHAEKSVEHAASLVAINGAELGEAHGQIAIAVQL